MYAPPHIREQGEQRINVGCGDLAKRRQVAMQGWHSVCPSVDIEYLILADCHHAARIN